MCSDDLVSPAPSPSCRFAPPLLYMFLSLSLFPPSLRFQPQDEEEGSTALFKAAVYGHTDVVKLLLTEGNAEVDKTVNGGSTPLFIAAQFGRTEVVKLLLRGGADTNIARNDGKTPLMIAKEEGHQAIVALLQ
jgi:ankyrin repeat protein